TMKGIVLNGTAPQLHNSLPIPPIGNREVRVKILYSTVNGHEIERESNRGFRFLNKLMGAKGKVQTGLEFSGIVESDGKVFSSGEKVLGYVDLARGWKPHAEYISISEQYLAPLPASLSLADAATLPMSAMTALVALRDIGQITQGTTVLILGASGGVGVTAVQIASILGASITTVAGASHHQLLKDLGADTVIDYKTTDITETDTQYELILDMTANYRFNQIRHLLTDDGIFIPANPFSALFDMLLNRKRIGWLYVDRGDSKMLTELAEWAAAGKLKSVIDSTFDLEDYRAAFDRALSRGKAGRVLIKIGEVD
ncbi:MAG: NAD(P)-dependent alcohol dehydrogenase, partial [Chloroflexota bacterium]